MNARRILVVDNEAKMRRILELSLKSLGHSVLEAGDGVEALAVIEQQSVDLVLTDLRMPRMDGFELIERVRAKATEADIPIIVVTADGAPETQSRAQRLGANAFFVKPYSPAAVRATLKELLNDTQPDADF